jgi:hypothetical protein
MNRTGSTAIQFSLAANNGRGFIYPLLGEPPFKPHHEDALDQIFSRERLEGATSSAFLPASSIREQSSHAMDASRLSQLATIGKAKIRDAAAAAGTAPVILSGEGAYRYLSERDLIALKEFLEELFDEIVVVAYVRPPGDHISSTFHNSVVGHRLSEFRPKYKSYSRLKKFDNIFGRDLVKLWLYHRSSFPSGDVVQHFAANLGLGNLSSAEANVTGSRPAVSAIYRLNRLVGENAELMKAHRQLVKTIRRRFPHRDWPKFRLSPQVISPLLDANAHDMEWMEARIGRSLRVNCEPFATDVANEGDLLQIEPEAREQLMNIGRMLSNEAARLLEQALAS